MNRYPMSSRVGVVAVAAALVAGAGAGACGGGGGGKSFEVQSCNMAPTLQPGDRVHAEKADGKIATATPHPHPHPHAVCRT